jgi:homoserine kinase
VDKPGVHIGKIMGDGIHLSTDPKKNAAGAAIQAFLDHIHSRQGVEIDIYKKMPIRSGLGSALASSVAAVYGLNVLLGEPVSRMELLSFAIEGCKASLGFALADNIAASLFGGFVLIRGYDPLDVVKIPVPDSLYCSILHLPLEIETGKSRKMLKKHIAAADAIAQWGNTAGLVAGLMKSDFELIGRSLEDRFAEPERAKLIPGFYEIKKAAKDAGAIGAGIAGKGPSLFALSTSYQKAETIASAMQKAGEEHAGKTGDIYISKVSDKGPRVIE